MQLLMIKVITVKPAKFEPDDNKKNFIILMEKNIIILYLKRENLSKSEFYFVPLQFHFHRF